MTRVNLVDPATLCDQHLLAEHREMTRVPNNLIKKIALGTVRFREVDQYTVRTNRNPAGGAGHEIFFYRHILFLKDRYREVHQECLRRGFNVPYHWPDRYVFPASYCVPWTPSPQEIALNVERINEMMPAKPRYTSPAS